MALLLPQNEPRSRALSARPHRDSRTDTASSRGDMPSTLTAVDSLRMIRAGSKETTELAASHESILPPTTSRFILRMIRSEAALVRTLSPPELDLLSAAVPTLTQVIWFNRLEQSLENNPVSTADSISWQQHYLRLGSTRDRQRHRQVWLETSQHSAETKAQHLLGFARRDDDIERLSDVSAILAQLGSGAMKFVRSELWDSSTTTSPLFIETLLRTIRWSALESDEATLSDLVTKFTNPGYDEDIREAAYSLLPRLPTMTRKRILQDVLQAENSPELRATLLELQDAMVG